LLSLKPRESRARASEAEAGIDFVLQLVRIAALLPHGKVQGLCDPQQRLSPEQVVTVNAPRLRAAMLRCCPRGRTGTAPPAGAPGLIAGTIASAGRFTAMARRHFVLFGMRF
jgi:hypothetical protein